MDHSKCEKVECNHAELKLCKECKVPYCTKCKKEWAEPCLLNHYFYYNYYRPTYFWETPMGDTTTYSDGHTITVGSTACNHSS
jgi:hypothetical protein